MKGTGEVQPPGGCCLGPGAENVKSSRTEQVIHPTCGFCGSVLNFHEPKYVSSRCAISVLDENTVKWCLVPGLSPQFSRTNGLMLLNFDKQLTRNSVLRVFTVETPIYTKASPIDMTDLNS